MEEESKALKMLLSISDKIVFFDGLRNTEIVSLISDVKILNYENKRTIFKEGETGRNYLFYLLKGKISISKLSLESNSKVRLATIDQPSLFGEMMRLTGEPRSATVEAAEDNTIVLAFKVKDFTENTPVSKFYKNVILELSNKINNMNKKVHQ
jgi:CRP-like cAMP-binding protein